MAALRSTVAKWVMFDLRSSEPRPQNPGGNLESWVWPLSRSVVKADWLLKKPKGLLECLTLLSIDKGKDEVTISK